MSDFYGDDEVRFTRAGGHASNSDAQRRNHEQRRPGFDGRNTRGQKSNNNNNGLKTMVVVFALIAIVVAIFSIVKIGTLSKDAQKHKELIQKYAANEQELETKLSKYNEMATENEKLKQENEELRKENESQKKQIERQAKIANGIPFTNEEKTVYLTFDDGPSQNTAQILEILKKYGVHATFFVIDNGANNHLMKDIVESGNAIGLHSQCHTYRQVYSSTDAFFEDLSKISDIVKQETGVESKVARFPGGASNTVSINYCKGIMTKLVDMTKEKGYYYYDWNVDSQDASGNNIPVSTIVESATAGIYYKYSDNLIVLMHDAPAKRTTVEALPQIIEAYQKAGIKFGVLNEDVPIYLQHVNN